MANDATYQPGVVQRRQDGDIAVVTGTSITVETGAGFTVESGGTATFASGSSVSIAGSITMTGRLAFPVEQGTTTAAFVNHGVTTFGTTAANAFTLTAPDRAGLFKILSCTLHGATTNTQTVTTTGANIIGASTVVAGTSVITFTRQAAVMLVSSSTSLWQLVAFPSANVAFT